MIKKENEMQENKITDEEALKIIKRNIYTYQGFVYPRDKEPRTIININLYEGTKDFEKIMRWVKNE